MTRYYLLDEDGNILKSYARPQPDRPVVRLDEPPDTLVAPKWDGGQWVENETLKAEHDAEQEVERKRREARGRISAATPPQSNPELAARVADIEVAMGLREPD